MASKIYLRTTEAAEILGVSTRTIRRRIKDGTIPAVKIGRLVRIPASAILPEQLDDQAAAE